MRLTPLPDRETRRQTGNKAWTPPSGYISGKIAHKALALKGMIQRDMGINSVEMANRICDALLADADTVANLENGPLEGVSHG